jgi:glycosyltransferase involved in cell wall biosynthesis
MISHAEALSAVGKSDVMVFPSLREFGGGVVFEALAMGAVPVVADHGGPGDIVTEEVGCRIPLTDETRMVTAIDAFLQRMATDRDHLERMRARGVAYAREQLTWEAKAGMVTQILQWAVRGGQKPVMPPPKPV